MSLLDGLAGVGLGLAGAGQAIAAQRTADQRDRALDQEDRRLGQGDRRIELDEGQLNINQRVQDLAEAREERGWSSEDSRGLIGLGMVSKFIDPSSNQFTDSLRQALQNGDPAAQDFAARLVGQARPERFAEGFQPNSFDFSTIPGSVVIQGAGPSGPGVVTQGGTSDPNDPVQPIPVDAFLQQLDRVLTDVRLTGYGAQYLNLAAQKGSQGEALSREEANRAQEEQDSLSRQSVLAPVYAQGGQLAGRELETILSGASQEEGREILKDLANEFGIELVGGARAEQPSTVTTSQDQPDFILDESTQRFIGQLDREISAAETRANSMENPSKRKAMERNIADLYDRREQAIRKSNNETFKSVEDDLAEAQNRLESATPGRKSYWQGEVDRLTQERDAAIKSGVDTPATKTDGWAQLENDVLSRVRGLSPEEVDRLVDEGKLQFTPETTAALRQRAAEVGVTKIADIKKLPTEEELAYRAITSVFAPDATTRENARREIDNLITTGDVSTSGSDRMRNETDRMAAQSAFMRARASLAETQRMLGKDADAQITAANSYAQTWLENINDALLEGDAEQAIKANFPSMVQEFNKYRGNQLALKDLYTATSAGLSRVFADYADRGLGNSAVDKFVSLFNPNPSDDPTDFKLERIRLDPAGRFLTYVGPTGRPQGEQVSVAALKNAIGEAAVDVLVAAAKANANAKAN